MARTWNSPIEAKINGSLCNFQLELTIAIPLPGIPTIPFPKFPPSIPLIDLECPADDSEEVIPSQ